MDPRLNSQPQVATGEQALWGIAQSHGINRRRFLTLLVAGGTAAVLSACGVDTFDPPSTPTQPPVSPGTSSPWFKDSGRFIIRDDKGLEARLENMRGLITPNRSFFVRNNSVSLDLDAADWRLSVAGNAVANPVQLSYEEIQRLPTRTMTAYLECAGNHRAMFDIVKGRRAAGTQWMTGAVGNGEWVGASLADVLTLAGIRPDAVSVLAIGLDAESPERGFRYALPVDKAMHPDTLLAYGLNGEPLPKDHGYPVRVLAPGWVGSASIKWLGRIVVSSQQAWTRNNTTSYVLIGDDHPAQGEAMGQPVTAQVIKSALALPWPAQLVAGKHRIHGYAQSPHGPIARVEWSSDSGDSWSDAEVFPHQDDRSWSRFEFNWNAEPGDRFIMTRAHDAVGNVQPDHIPFNEKGYLFNQPVPHPVRVPQR